jgi:hypothetical protein
MLDVVQEAFNSVCRDQHRLEAELHETKRRWNEEKVKHRAALDNVEVLKSENETWERSLDNATRTIEAQAREVARMAQELLILRTANDRIVEVERENAELKGLDAYKLRKERDLYKRAFSWAREATSKMMVMLDRDKKDIEG